MLCQRSLLRTKTSQLFKMENMRSLSIAVVAFLLSVTCLQAQTLLAEFSPADPKSKLDNILLAHQKDGPYGLCYTTRSNIVIQVLDAAGQLVYQKESQDGNTSLVPQGSLETDSTFHFIYMKDLSLEFLVVTAGKKDAVGASIQAYSPLGDNVKFLGSIVSQNECYVLGLQRKEQKLVIGRFLLAERKFESKEIALGADLTDKLRKPLSSRAFNLNLTNEANMVAVSETTLPEPGLALPRHKLYLLKNGQLALTLEGRDYERCQTELLLMDWEKGQVEVRELGPNVLSDGFRHITNSYIHDNMLALFQVERDFIYLAIYDIDSLKTKKEYNYADSDTLHLMGSRLFTETDGSTAFIDTKAYSKEQTGKVLKKLSRGTPFVYFEPNGNGDLVFTLGNQMEQGGGGGWSGGMPGQTIGTPSGPVYMPGTPGVFTPYGSSYKLSRYFFSVLNESDLSIKSENALKSDFLSRKLKRFVDEHIEGTNNSIFAQKPVYELFNIPQAGYAVVASYVKKEGKIRLHKIKL